MMRKYGLMLLFLFHNKISFFILENFFSSHVRTSERKFLNHIVVFPLVEDFVTKNILKNLDEDLAWG
jgi:hypothetical protein